MDADDPRLVKWLDGGGNCGVGGGNQYKESKKYLMIFDSDDSRLEQIAAQFLPNTFTVEREGPEGRRRSS